jgi:hypothetical protein
VEARVKPKRKDSRGHIKLKTGNTELLHSRHSRQELPSAFVEARPMRVLSVDVRFFVPKVRKEQA